ncbi:MAG: Rieske 2Fe-2S domain-containing protein [Myxococcales bacterium]|nr:Rieske 2Fe-2S domain-containing protein [Myxococcales bacterium]
MSTPIQIRTRDDEKNYDFSPYPTSWIQIGWSHELRRGQVRAVRCLGRELVLFRGEDGRVRVVDAYCPHLGAHLGVGGSVVGNDLRCPFHGWEFDGAGACTRIPYARKIPKRARLGAWTVREVNGQILIWHDADGRPPWFTIPEVPEFGSKEWTKPRIYETTIRTRWRELVENGVDRGHFFALHEFPEPPELEFRTDGPRFSMTSRVRWRRFGIQRTVSLDIDAWGAGFSLTRGHGEAPFLVLGCPMPIDEHSIVHRQAVIVSRRLPPGVRDLVARFVGWTAMREFRRDVPIWQNKVVIPRPVLCDGDGPIVRFRTWARQFEPGAAPATAAAEN